MKLFYYLIAIVGMIALPVTSRAQGYLTFANLFIDPASSSTGVIYEVGGTTPIDGSNYTLQLYGGTSSDPSTFTLIGTITQSSQGTFTASSSTAVTGTTSGQTYYYQIRVYDNTTGASYAAATVRGASAVTSITLATQQNAIFTETDNFMNFSLAAVPEPTTLALAGMGGVAMLMRRRKKVAA